MHKLTSILALFKTACTNLTYRRTPTDSLVSGVSGAPYGFKVVEMSPKGYFIRLTSPERASKSKISVIAEKYSGKFDRIDLCLDVAKERGDEYVSVIGNQVYDYENDNIYIIK